MKPKGLTKKSVECSDQEASYRENTYKDVSTALSSRLSCTCCLKDVKNVVLIKEKVYIHPFFKVLVCKECLKFYGDGYISADADGSDKYCRWCGQGGYLYLCSQCPVAICKGCVNRNMSRTARKDVEKDDWKCFSCNPEPLYELRALAWAVKSFLKSNKSVKEVPPTPVQVSTVADTLQGQLKNGVQYMFGVLKELQNICNHFRLRMSGIYRRKDMMNEENLSLELLTKTLEEVRVNVAKTSSKFGQQVQDLSSFIDKLSLVVEELKKNNAINENRGAIDEDRKTTERVSSDNGNSEVQAVGNSDVIDKEERGPTKLVIQTVKSEGRGSQPIFRIRKIEEVNKVLLKQKVNNVDCEVIDLDDDDCADNSIIDKSSNELLTSSTSTLSQHEPDDRPSAAPMHVSCENDVQTSNSLVSSDSQFSSHSETNETKTKNGKSTDKEGSNSTTNSCKNDKATDKEDCETSTKSLADKSVTKRSVCKEDSICNSPSNSKKSNVVDGSKSGCEQKPCVERSLCQDDNPKSETNRNHSVDMFSDNDDVVTITILSSTSTSSSTDSDNIEVTSKRKRVAWKRKGDPGPSNKKTDKRESDSDSDSEIEKLFNTKSLDGNRSKRDMKKGGDRTTKVKKEMGSTVKRPGQKTILDYFDEESDESVIDLVAELESLKAEFMEEGCEAIAKKASSDTRHSILFTGSLNSDDTSVSGSGNDSVVSGDSDDLLRDSDEDRRHKKKRKDKGRSEQDSDSSQGVNGSKSTKWKKDKLLTAKLSDDSSDSDDSTFKMKNPDKKSDKRGKKKIIVISGSEEDAKKNSRNSSESGDSDASLEEPSDTKKRKRIKNMSSSSAEDDVEGSANKGHRKNIRKVLKKDSLNESTQSALKEEQERKKRISERQKLYNQMMEGCEIESSSKVEKLVLDFDVKSKQEILSVDKDLVAKLKPHQAEGIKFMWDSCFETVEKAKKGKGSGCILAHCMGLGKTLQVVSLIHSLLMNDVGVKTVLVLCPLSTVLNWVNEFDKWLSDIGSGADVDVFHLTKVNAMYRANQLRDWQRRGGVMILGYNLFRLLVNPTKRLKAAIKTAYLETLCDPGADIVICDEGHLLKNEKTALSKAVEKIATLRRIVLTGTPLQNNLVEYHCMMQFVKPNLLGTRKEFVNRFVNPIENGQFVDSTPHDVKVMKRRAHVLHKMLDGLVQRKAYTVLVPFLPTKHEYVLSLALTDIQVKLYQYYLDNFSRNQSGTGAGTSLFKDRNMLSLICAHPRLLKIQNENELMRRDLEESDEEGSLKDFVVHSSSESSSSQSLSSSGSDDDNSDSDEVVAKRIHTRNSAPVLDEEENSKGSKEDDKREGYWWDSIAQEDDMTDIGSSCKLLLFFSILQKCQDIGDKLLLFSQSLLVLDLIEFFLDKIDNESQGQTLSQGLRGFNGSWVRGLDYFRLDGKTSSENRSIWCKRFNSEDNHRARLFLISTRAGGLGINLTGANRVILFDASWNPSHDVQSIFRIYRFGQDKPCYIYRFLNKGTMEQKVYDRQVTKLSMSCRVIDEQQIDRHFSFADLNELYTFTPNEKDDKTPPLPKDRLLAELLQEQKDVLLSYHTHDSLLENQENEELNEEERKQAWADFENEKNPPPSIGSMSNFAETYHKVFLHLSQRYPTWSEDELKRGTLQVINKMNAINIQNQTNQNQVGNTMFQQQYGNLMRAPVGGLQQNLPHMYNSQYEKMPGAGYTPASSALLRMPNTSASSHIVRGPQPNPSSKFFTNPYSGISVINPFSQSLQNYMNTKNQVVPGSNVDSNAAPSQSSTGGSTVSSLTTQPSKPSDSQQ